MGKVTLTSPVTGATVSGLTSPTYTVTSDVFPGQNPGAQWVVTGLGGTQTGVRTSTVGNPFTLAFWRGGTMYPAPTPNPVTGVIPADRTYNKHGAIMRTGVIPLVGQNPKMMTFRLNVEVPPGADTSDAPQIRAAVSFFIGALAQQASNFADQVIAGLAPSP